MKGKIIIATIIAVALIISSSLIKVGMENTGKSTLPEMYSLYGFEGALYRLNSVNGRIDVLVPSNEAALLFPVSQMQLPAANANLTAEQKASLAKNMMAVSRYLQGERMRNLGVDIETGASKAAKQ